MHFDKALFANLIMQDDMACSDTFATLLEQLYALPRELWGIKALEMSAILVEVAAYELASRLDCAEVGALIQCSAELAERSAELADARIADTTRPMVLVQ